MISSASKSLPPSRPPPFGRVLLGALSAAWLVVAWVPVVGFSGGVAAQASDFADGLAAYDGGRYAEAVAAWTRAAETGNTQAMNALASLLARGEGVAPDPAAAARWYRRTAARGDPIGQMNLGDMLSRGFGVGRDPEAAYLWLGLAAKQKKAWAADRQREVGRGLTPNQRQQLDDRITAWKPNPAS